MPTTLEVLTPSGYQNFYGVTRNEHHHYLKFTLSDGKSIMTALKHRFIIDSKEVFADSLDVGDYLTLEVFIQYIERIDTEDGEWFYDLLSVENGAVFNHDGNIVSHNSFLGNSNTLVSPEALLSLMAADPVEYRNSVRYYTVPTEGHKYVMTVDPAKGRGQDYSTFTVIDITQKPFIQVATYRDNLISPLIFPGVIVQVAKMYNDAIVVIENNNGGEVVANGVYYEYEYENTFVESSVKSGGVGINMTSKVKRIGCSNLKDLIETYNLVVVDADCIIELSCFETSGSSYEASDGNHDDLVMNLVLFSWFVSSAAFGDVSNIDLTNMLYSERLREMEEDVPSFGIIESYEPTLSPEFLALRAQRDAWSL